IELLLAYDLIPEELRPKEAMEAVRAMLAKHLPVDNAKVEELLPMDFSQLQWNDQLRLERVFGDGTTKMFPPADQQTAEGIVLHR
ncbi:hypothetical protein, partial [Lactococcus petauri]|uniref:hypothetical protein n=1 Tax=Lactococcus petauri TaxID=1940789 RepID=UPI0021F10318